MALFIVGFLLSVLAIVGFIYHFIIFKKSRDILSIDKKYKIIFNLQIFLFAISCLMCGYGIVSLNKLNLDAGNTALLIIGCLFFGASFFLLFECFTINFYKPELNTKERKIVKILMFVMIPFTIIFFFMSTEGYAPYLTFPLVRGINFSKDGVKFFTALNTPTSGFTIAWYGLIMLGGAIVAYFVCDHHFYKEYKKHGIIDTMFVLVFLMGIFGARVWYCLILEPGTPFFDFQNGGLAIMGGALFGAISGIAFILIFRRYINIRHAMDMILPCVLIAQAIGRWGNFFNCEVHGNPVNGAYFAWLPTIIFNQLKFSSVGNSLLGTDNIYLPLFFIELISNLAGYFVIEHAYKKGIGKRASMGDRFFCYLIWYGLTRVILEPLRFGGFIYNNSYITAWVMFGGGIAAIIILHIYDYFRWGKRTFILSNQMLIESSKNPYFKNNKNEEIKN